MAIISGTISRYHIRIASPVEDHVTWFAVIYLDVDADIALTLGFYDDEAPLPPNGKTRDDPVPSYSFYYHRRDYEPIVDLLRQEAPLGFVYVEAEEKLVLRTKAWEPVGESEPVRLGARTVTVGR